MRAADRSKVPAGPVDLEEVVQRFPTVRQSLLQTFDDCPLSALFQDRYERGWSTHAQARGLMFHRFAAEALREMQRQDSESVPVPVALAILEDIIRQHGVEPRDVIRVPLREIPALRMAVVKFAKDNSFSIRKIVDVERRLAAKITYAREGTGEAVERMLTGQLDVLIAQPPDEAIVVDWKDTWGLPPERHPDAEDPGVSYHGYFQQRYYGWLVMRSYPSINAVTLREFYPRRTEVREARITRADLDRVEADLAVLVEAFDRAVSHGRPATLSMRDVEASHWTPQPGVHCAYCVAPHRCPVEDEASLPKALRTPEQASRWAAARTVGKAVAKRADEMLRPYVNVHGPIPLRKAKGRRVLGYRTLSTGKVRWDEWTPEGVDRPPTRDPETDAPLEAAAREARGAA